MLDSFRSLASGFWSKLLLALLILSFAVWGIGDMMHPQGGNRTIATVGSADISANELRRSLHDETENLRRLLGRDFTPELMASMQLSQQVLQKLINRTLLKLESDSLGLTPSNEDVVRRIHAMPHFQNDKGRFEKQRFDSALQSIGMTEKQYVELLRQDIAINLLLDTITNAAPVSEAMATTLLAAQEERRSIALYALSASSANTLSKPDEETLEAWYKAHQAQFTIPEYRTVSYLSLTPEDVQKTLTVSEEALKQAYAERENEFKRPERRAVKQLLYATQDDANKAHALLESGASFDNAAKTTPIQNKDTLSLGKVERQNIIESAAEAVFSLSVNQYTKPLQSPFGWHIFQVTAIDKAHTANFDEARPQLEKELKQHQSDAALNQLVNKLQDDLAGGSTLKEIATELNVKLITAGPLSETGTAPDGKAAPNIPPYESFLETAFDTEEHSESPLMTSKGGIFYVLRVDSVTPQRIRPLEEVRDAVLTGWEKDTRQKQLAALATAISAELKDTDTRSAVIAKHNLKPLNATVSRDDTKAGAIPLPAPLIDAIFEQPLQGSTDAYPLPDGGYALAVVHNVVPPEGKDSLRKEALASLRDRIRITMENELVEQYTRYLSTKYDVWVDEAALQTVVN